MGDNGLGLEVCLNCIKGREGRCEPTCRREWEKVFAKATGLTYGERDQP